MRIVTLLLMALTLLTISGCSGGPTRWEYRVLQIPAKSSMPDLPEVVENLISKQFDIPEYLLNNLGMEGWELVGTIPEVETSHLNLGSSEDMTRLQPKVRSCRVTLIFKRPWTGKSAPPAATSPAPMPAE
ncbi:MAG: hypothetical protein ACOX9B_03245 [Candidatus Xenobium sp.]|jgi:hypothetical protein|nr:hypothetical protein [Burkholderiales bacterium]